MTVMLLGVVGSTAYGLAHADSDIDRLGVFKTPTKQILSLHRPDETKVTKDDLGDMTLHEVEKFMRLCIQCNPTVMELLWLDDYLVQEYAGSQIVQLRSDFLSKRAVDSYMGYAFQQATRLVNRGGTFDPDLKKRTQKHGRHCWRLILQGRKLIETGELVVRLTESEAQECRDAGISAESNPQEFFNAVKHICDSIKDAGQGVLPDEPNLNKINYVLYDIRVRGLI